MAWIFEILAIGLAAGMVLYALAVPDRTDLSSSDRKVRSLLTWTGSVILVFAFVFGGSLQGFAGDPPSVPYEAEPSILNAGCDQLGITGTGTGPCPDVPNYLAPVRVVLKPVPSRSPE